MLTKRKRYSVQHEPVHDENRKYRSQNLSHARLLIEICGKSHIVSYPLLSLGQDDAQDSTVD